MKFWTDIKSLQMKVANIIVSAKYLVVFDTETTGLTSQDRIIELAAQKYRLERSDDGDIRFVFVEEFHEYINPYPLVISPEITAINHIAQEDVEDKPAEDVIIPLFKEWCGEDFAFIAHNANFDTTKLNQACERLGIEWEFSAIDTLELSRALLEIENNKLITIAEHYDVIPDDANFHAADFDVSMTALIAERLLNELRHKKPVVGTRRPAILSISEFSKGHTQRTYIQTTIGSVFYDRKTHRWGAGTKAAPLDIDIIDMDHYLIPEINKILANHGIASIANLRGTISV